MAWTPLSHTMPQYEDVNGVPYSGAVLKAYSSGTSTNINLATDSTGGTQVSSIALNATGYPEVSGTIVIPHVNEKYKLMLFPSQAAADSDTGEIWAQDALAISGDFGASTQSITSTTVLDSTDRNTHINASGAITITLPDIDVVGAGYVFTIRNDDAGTNNVTLIGDDASEEVNLATSVIFTPGDSGLVQSGVVGAVNSWSVTGFIGSLGLQTEQIAAEAVTQAKLDPTLPGSAAGGELTIATGSITPTNSTHPIDTEADAGTDDLDTIVATNFVAGQRVTFSLEDAARDVVFKDGTGNIQNPNNIDITMAGADDRITYEYDGTNFVFISKNFELGVLLRSPVVTSTTSRVTGTAAIPYDDTIPQITEGTQGLTQAYTPLNANSTLRITISGNMSSNASHDMFVLFVQGTNDALASQIDSASIGNGHHSMSLIYEESAISTSSRTYELRFGGASGTANQFRLNGNGSIRIHGGVLITSMTIEEYI